MPTLRPFSNTWSPPVQKTMVDCGEYTYWAWKKGEAIFPKYLGPFNPDMPREELDRRLEHEKYTAQAVEDFWKGFEKAKKADRLTKPTFNDIRVP